MKTYLLTAVTLLMMSSQAMALVPQPGDEEEAGQNINNCYQTTMAYRHALNSRHDDATYYRQKGVNGIPGDGDEMPLDEYGVCSTARLKGLADCDEAQAIWEPVMIEYNACVGNWGPWPWNAYSEQEAFDIFRQCEWCHDIYCPPHWQDAYTELETINITINIYLSNVPPVNPPQMP